MKLEWKTCFKVGASAFLLYLCICYWPVVAGLVGTLLGAAAPLFIGAAIAYILNILMSFYERHYFPRSSKAFWRKTRRPVCLVTSMLSLLAVVVLVLFLVIPQLISCIQLIVAELPGAIRSAIGYLNKWHLLPADFASLLSSVDWQSRLGQVFDLLASGIGDVVSVVVNTVVSVFSGVVTAFLSVVFAIYLLISKETLGRQVNRLLTRYLRPAWREKVYHTGAVLNDCFHRYIVGQCTEAVILGALCALGMWALGLPYAAMIGALVAFTALVPIAGAFIGAGIGAFMIFTVSPLQALIFLIFIIILQQLEENLIYPRVVGSSLGLPGLWVLAAVTVGGGVMGILGMLLGVPLTAAAYRLLRQDMQKEKSEKSEVAK